MQTHVEGWLDGIDLLDLNKLNYFRVAAKYENFSKAAEELFISQPSISKTISQLEESLETPLFERKRGRVSLTKQGLLLYEHMNRAVSIMENGIAEVRMLGKTDSNAVRFGSTVHSYISRLIKSFCNEHGDIPILQNMYDYDSVLRLLLSGELDLALTIGPVNNSGLEWIPLFEEEYLVMLRTGHRFFGRRDIWLAELKDDEFANDSLSIDPAFLRRLCGSAGYSPNFLYNGNDHSTYTTMLAMNARLVAFAPAFLLWQKEGGLPDGVISFSRINDPGATLGIGIAKNKSGTLSRAGQVFFEFLLSYFRGYALERDAALEEYFSKKGKNGRGSGL